MRLKILTYQGRCNMSFNFIKKFWFKSSVLLLSILVLSSWALRPISHDEINQQQKKSLVQLGDSVGHILDKSFSDLNLTLRYLIENIDSQNKSQSLDSYATSVKALFALENKNNNLNLTGKEIRSLDLSYWSPEDLKKSMNRLFASEDNSFDLGLQMMSSPSGVNYYGYLFLDQGNYYLALLSLRFAVEWSESFKYKNSDIVLINSLGELVYHPEFQYIGTEYNLSERIFDNLDVKKEQVSLTTRDNVYFAKSAGLKDLYLVVSSKKWATAYGPHFYGKFLLVFIAMGLLIYYWSHYFTYLKEEKLHQIHQKDNDRQEWTTIESKGLLDKIRKLEIQLAQVQELSGKDSMTKSLYDLKSKSANLIGQIQLIKGQPENMESLLTSLEEKSRSIYKKVFQMIDEPSLMNETMPPLPGELSAESNKKREIDYSFESKDSEVSFIGEDQRIEINEEDLGMTDDQDDLGIIEGFVVNKEPLQFIEDEVELSDEDKVEQNIKRQLQEQNYKSKKPFNIDDIYLSEQAKKADEFKVNFSESLDFEDQMSRVDKIIESVDKGINSTSNDMRSVVREPRLKELK